MTSRIAMERETNTTKTPGKPSPKKMANALRLSA